MARLEERRTARTAVRLTYDDFVHFPDDGKRHELIDGAHYVTPSPNVRHQRILGNLHLLIGNWLETNPIGHVFVAPLDVVLSNHDVVAPDVLYLSNERAAQTMTPANIRGVPELVVEIASKGTRRRDETIKRKLYEGVGVAEYWVVDPTIDVVRVYRQENAGPRRPIELSRETSDVLATPLLPGLQLPLGRIFRE